MTQKRQCGATHCDQHDAARLENARGDQHDGKVENTDSDLDVDEGIEDKHADHQRDRRNGQSGRCGKQRKRRLIGHPDLRSQETCGTSIRLSLQSDYQGRAANERLGGKAENTDKFTPAHASTRL